MYKILTFFISDVFNTTNISQLLSFSIFNQPFFSYILYPYILIYFIDFNALFIYFIYLFKLIYLYFFVLFYTQVAFMPFYTQLIFIFYSFCVLNKTLLGESRCLNNLFFLLTFLIYLS